MHTPLLSFILPVRCTADRPAPMELALRAIEKVPAGAPWELLVVGYGTDAGAAEKLHSACTSCGARHLALDGRGRGSPITTGEALDFGSVHARGSYIAFLDSEVLLPDDFFARILDRTGRLESNGNCRAFFLLPRVSLTRRGSTAFEARPRSKAFELVRRMCLEQNADHIESFEPDSTLLVANRFHYLLHGGHRRHLETHRQQSAELKHRLARHHGNYSLPENYYDSRPPGTSFAGYRSLLALYGLPLFHDGLFAVSLWQPGDRFQGDIAPSSGGGEEAPLLAELQSFDQGGEEPPPLADLSRFDFPDGAANSVSFAGTRWDHRPPRQEHRPSSPVAPEDGAEAYARLRLPDPFPIILERLLREPEVLLSRTDVDCPRLVEGLPEQHQLAVILPLRISSERPDALERLDFVRADRIAPAGVRFCVVDDGSEPHLAQALREKCRQNGFAYIRIDSGPRLMSLARCRNVGAMYMKADFVLFQDVDLMPYDGFYQSVLDELQVQEVEENAERFLMYGVIYLTPEGTSRFNRSDPRLRRQRFIQHLLDNDTRVIEKFSTATSVVVMNRHNYLLHGGTDQDFEGWGYEDIEFACRSIRRLAKYPLPSDFSLDYKNAKTITEYRGFKAIQRLFGDQTFQKGQVLFHAWHPVDPQSAYLQEGRARNLKLFEEKLKRFHASRAEPAPLPDMSAGRTLVFTKTNPFVINPATISQLGEIVFAEERHFSPRTLVDFVRCKHISQVLFFNPFATDARLALYRAVRQAAIPCLIAERGALPGATFFDRNGFNAESSSYDAAHWDHPLDERRRAQALAYMDTERSTDSTLEAQGARIGASRLRQQLGLEVNQKVLFVALQRPSDSVIKHFCGDIGTYEHFIELTRQTTLALPPDWKVVVKKHPLEDQRPDVPGALFADSAHVKDLLELCDAVLLINSGVGILSMIWAKPVLHAGAVFYGHPDINRQVRSPADVIAALTSGFCPDREKVVRFVSYLVNDFYSFGQFKTREDPWKDGGRMTVTTSIEFQQVCGLSRIPFRVRIGEKKPEVALSSSILFDRYRYHSNGAVAARIQAASTPPSNSPSAAQAGPSGSAPLRPASVPAPGSGASGKPPTASAKPTITQPAPAPDVAAGRPSATPPKNPPVQTVRGAPQPAPAKPSPAAAPKSSATLPIRAGAVGSDATAAPAASRTSQADTARPASVKPAVAPTARPPPAGTPNGAQQPARNSTPPTQSLPAPGVATTTISVVPAKKGEDAGASSAAGLIPALVSAAEVRDAPIAPQKGPAGTEPPATRPRGEKARRESGRAPFLLSRLYQRLTHRSSG